jgi:hypothetical protein
MVLEVLAHSRGFDHGIHTCPAQLVGIAYPGTLEENGRADGACGHNDLGLGASRDSSALPVVHDACRPSLFD